MDRVQRQYCGGDEPPASIEIPPRSGQKHRPGQHAGDQSDGPLPTGEKSIADVLNGQLGVVEVRTIPGIQVAAGRRHFVIVRTVQ